jgi:hypothetical protein
MTRWSDALLRSYLKRDNVALMDTASLFLTPGSASGASGRPSQDKLVSDFADLRAEVFGANERRQLADMRRSDAIEATRGKADPAALSSKMANALASPNRLHRTYVPVDVATVRSVDEARETSRREQKQSKSVKSTVGEV